jgi:hypothetical protein
MNGLLVTNYVCTGLSGLEVKSDAAIGSLTRWLGVNIENGGILIVISHVSLKQPYKTKIID